MEEQPKRPKKQHKRDSRSDSSAAERTTSRDRHRNGTSRRDHREYLGTQVVVLVAGATMHLLCLPAPKAVGLVPIHRIDACQVHIMVHLHRTQRRGPTIQQSPGSRGIALIKQNTRGIRIYRYIRMICIQNEVYLGHRPSPAASFVPMPVRCLHDVLGRFSTACSVM